ncbi:4Fe-4S dicluster domain-containing protein [Neolewinella agarilytica]|uniref:Cytochrome c oxidase accessory protein FixG n=1 Tax=Neolewinella agarilytica TaxID=478744 RepID=A0A1H9ENN8_9BACT|nr:4Fe-4S dicluster domain-containing protein [Neolewinella agarilytica]SEQ27330.1 cytochrome c oxidase accessory protein FixG [Neolewinella agarilytica]
MSKKQEQGSFRDTIATVDADGKRNWIYPKRPAGRYYNWRTYLSYLLLAILFGLPWIRVGGEPIIMLNVLERKFILLGMLFSPQDFQYLAILMITAVVFIALFTVVFGRIFCGWVCPQTIFMEMVFRKIEYWIEGDANAQRKLAKAPWTPEKIRKKVTKQALFLLVAALIAHTFLAYIIGTDEVIATVSQSPLSAPGGFIAIVIFIGVFYFVFANMREQVCIAICPYGRLQGVLLDEDSVNVIYDYERGEPRGKIRKGKPKKSSCTDCENCRDGKDSCGDQMVHRMEAALAAGKHDASKPSPVPAKAPLAFSDDGTVSLVAETPKTIGDCIDCTLCVQVCPTGIDIRNGIQMECINCTACIDACDAVMDKIDRPRGLIRYDSEAGVARGERKIWTPRVIAYSVVLLALIILNVVMLGSRDGLDVILLRTPGTLYQENADGSLNNLYTYQVVNKTGKELSLRFEVMNVSGAKVRAIGSAPVAQPGEVTEGALFIDVPAGDFPDELTIGVWSGDEQLETISTSFLHPK